MDFSHLKLIEEVKKRPELYTNERIDREVKMKLWKEVGAAIFPDWNQLNKAAAYDRVLFTQKKWRSFRDAYLRELRSQKSGIRINRTVYKYFKHLLFLGGFEGNPDDIADREYITPNTIGEADDGDSSYDPLTSPKSARTRKKLPKKRRMKQESESHTFDNDCEDEVEVPVYSMDVDSDADNDKLFLLSFLPEMKQLPINIKMWARAQIANIMQEAINSQFNNTVPGKGAKRPRKDSSDY